MTGDKILCHFEVNGAGMGAVASASEQGELALDVTGDDRLDQVVIYRNAEPWRVLAGDDLRTEAPEGRYKMRLEMGWGKSEDPYLWRGVVRVDDGSVEGIEGCFRGVSRLAPTADRTEDPDVNAVRNGILSEEPDRVAWESTTFANVSTLHPQTAAIVLEIAGDAHTHLEIEANGVRISQSLGKLARRGVAEHVQPWASEALLVHRAVPDVAYRLRGTYPLGRLEPGDTWYAEIRQANEQFAWLSPVLIGD